MQLRHEIIHGLSGVAGNIRGLKKVDPLRYDKARQAMDRIERALNEYQPEDSDLAQIPRAVLRRFENGVGGFWFNGKWVAFSLENPEKQIQAGNYVVVRDDKGKHQWFRLLDVPGRTNIEIHPANKRKELKGCIALGLRLEGEAIAQGESRPALEGLSELLGERTAFILTIA